MASYGKVAVTVASAIIVVPAGTELQSVLIQNLGPNTIWVGNDSSVTTATGTQVLAGKAISYNRQANDGIYAIASTADQVSPADTRWLGEPRF